MTNCDRNAEIYQKELASLRTLAQKQAGELAELSAEAQSLRLTAREQKTIAEECRKGSRHTEELRLADMKRLEKAEKMLEMTSADLLELLQATRESIKRGNTFRKTDEESGTHASRDLAPLIRDGDVEAKAEEEIDSKEADNSMSTTLTLHRTGSLSVFTRRSAAKMLQCTDKDKEDQWTGNSDAQKNDSKE